MAEADSQGARRTYGYSQRAKCNRAAKIAHNVEETGARGVIKYLIVRSTLSQLHKIEMRALHLSICPAFEIPY